MAAREAWWKGLSREQWLVLAVAFLGWVFDIMDTALFNLTKGTMLAELAAGLPKEEVSRIDGLMGTILLVGWSVGGLFFGVLADRWGRTRTMIVTILLYAFFTGAHALCQTWEQLAAVRFLTALGIGGEWAAGAALLAEAFPDKARAPAAGLLQSAAAVGPILAALIYRQIPAEQWRWVFVVGVAPALVTILIRLKVKEPERWTKARVLGGKEPFWAPLTGMFGNPRWRRHAIVALFLGAVMVAGSMNVSYWQPNIIESLSAGLPDDLIRNRKSDVLMLVQIGTMLGVLFAPWLCERIGRRLAIGLFFAMSPVAIFLATRGQSYEQFLLLAPVMWFFAVGVSGAFVLYLPEMFPTRFRATGAGFAYNVGRVLAAGVPLLTSALMVGSENPTVKGVAMTAGVLAVGILVLPFAPETRGKPLPEEGE